MAMVLTDALLRVVRDSRGDKTIEASLRSDFLRGRASVPCGKSRGGSEAFLMDPEYAVASFAFLRGKIIGKNFERQEDFDNFLLDIDGTRDKHVLGGNVMLALSIAWARIKAREEKKELYAYIADIYGGSRIVNRKSRKALSRFPRLFLNVINGGLHSGNPKNKLDFQEFIIIPGADNPKEAFQVGKRFYAVLRRNLYKKFGRKKVFIGDEGGFCPPFKNSGEALDFLSRMIKEYKLDVRLGLDSAATTFYRANAKTLPYAFEGKSISSKFLALRYAHIAKKYDLVSIEDPFNESDFSGFAGLKKEFEKRKLTVLIVADDLTTTNVVRLKRAVKIGSGDALIIKPNQIGTVTETLRTAKEAESSGWKTIVSNRSGETRDNFIADLAVGIRAWGFKAGAPIAKFRVSKYKRLLEIQKSFF